MIVVVIVFGAGIVVAAVFALRVVVFLILLLYLFCSRLDVS